MYITEKENIKIFIKNYFNNLRIKQYLFLAFVFIIITCLTTGTEGFIISIIPVILITIFIFFICPDLLRKETEKSIQNSYNKILKNNNELIIICNLKKYNGPTFGTLHVTKNTIEFKPFKDNLQNERFLIKEIDMKDIKISLLKIKTSVFYRELNKAISISCDGLKVLLQTPEPERAIEEIKRNIL